MKTKRKFIGHLLLLPREVKKEYLSKKKKHPVFVTVEIYSDKQYGAVAKLYERNSLFDRARETTTKKQRERISKSIAKIGTKKDKPLDTSKWVKPDQESIRNALVESLFALEILKEDSLKFHEHYGRAKVLYAILHDHSPENPQHLGNWGIDPYFQSLMQEFKCPVIKKWWDNFDKELKKRENTEEDWNKRRQNYQVWKTRCLKHMIIPDPKPHRYKDIFKMPKTKGNPNTKGTAKNHKKGTKSVKGKKK